MDARLLPPDEWPRLTGTELEQVWPTLDPTTAQIVVVEQDGAIIGCWALVMCLLAEGVWIAESYRRRGVVAAKLWQQMTAIVHACNHEGVLTHAASDDVRALLEHHGATAWPPPGTTGHLLPMRDPVHVRLGRTFHATLHPYVPESHADDPAHDEAVGRAIARAWQQDDGAGAADAYNAWATTHGYAPIAYRGREGQLETIMMDRRRIGIARDGSVRVYQEA